MSTTPGWYPDPDGEDTLRHWDGRRWSARTATEAEIGITPPAPRGGLPGWAWLALVGSVVVALLWGALLLSGKAPTVRPTASAPLPTAAPTFTGDPCGEGLSVRADGKPDHDYSVLAAKRLRVPRPDGWLEFRSSVRWLSLVSMRYLDSTKHDDYVHAVVVGSVRRSGAFPDLKTAAERVSGCFSKEYNKGATLQMQESVAATIDGASAWRYRVKTTAGAVIGRLEVHVVDAGDPDSFDVIITDAVVGEPAEKMLADLPAQAKVRR